VSVQAEGVRLLITEGMIMRHPRLGAVTRGTRATVVVLLAAVASHVPALGQEPTEANAAVRSFWVTEAGYSHSVSGPCSDHYPSFEVGKLVNLGGSVAAGATLFVGHNADVVFGPLPRVRYWASGDVALDMAGGMLWGASRTRPMAYASVNYRDLLSGFVQYERYRDGGCGQPTENQMFFGVKVGSRPGVVTGVVGSVLAGIIIVAVIAGIEN
jgi:hypothetical protein